MNNTPTPETDAEIKLEMKCACYPNEYVSGDFARKLERERDEAREIAAGKAYEMIEVLWSISLSDHLGDVAEAIAPILKQYGIPVMSLPALHEELKKRDLRPQWAREDD